MPKSIQQPKPESNLQETVAETAGIATEGLDYLSGLFDSLVELAGRSELRASSVLGIARAGVHIAGFYRDTLESIGENAAKAVRS
jgi:hypothetical protein